jgi:hypothetical protein
MLASPPGQRAVAVVPRPLAVDFQQVGTALTPPTQAQCNAVGRRCFAPAALQNAYNLSALYAAGNQGQGPSSRWWTRSASNTIRTDLNNFSTQFGLPHMCGEANYTCAPAIPRSTSCASRHAGHEVPAGHGEQRGQAGPERLDR